MAGKPGKKCTITIYKNDQGRWIVTKPKEKANRNEDTVEWLLEPDPDGHAVSAHFQFTYPKATPLFKAQRGLTRDKTAKILKPGERLTLEVHENACRRTNPHYYAVWISDRSHPDGGTFAVGEDLNPPPEINIGP